MLRGNWRDQQLGCGSDVWKYWAEKRAGNITDGNGARSRTASRARPGTA